jgi:hypothetical protein
MGRVATTPSGLSERWRDPEALGEVEAEAVQQGAVGPDDAPQPELAPRQLGPGKEGRCTRNR